MIVDKNLQFSDAQAVTAAAASDSVIDFGSARDMGTGEDLYVVVECTVAMTDSGSDSTLDVALEGDSTTSFTPDSTRTLFQFPALSAIGTIKMAKLGPDDANLQYARLKYTPNNGSLTTGSFTAYLTNNVQRWNAYADKLVISG